MSDVYTMVLAGGVGSRLSVLTEQRAKPAVPFGGKFRIVDFALSNCANSGLFDIGLLTQYRPMSLIEHVGTGRTWDLDRTLGGLQVLQPYLEEEEGRWYQGTADAVYRNLLQVTQRSVEDVLILSGDHVYAMDYQPFLRFHRERRFPATIAVTPVPADTTDQFGIVSANDKGQIIQFQEKPKQAQGNLASMGVYVFRRDTLIRLLEEDAADPDSAHDFGKNIFPRLIQVADVGAHTYHGYWQDIGTVEAFYEANLKLLDPGHSLKLGHPTWPIRTPSVDAAAARITGGGRVHHSLVANGAVVRGVVVNSILFPGVEVADGAVVEDSILMNDVQVHEDSHLSRVICDKRVRIGRGAVVGGAGGGEPNTATPDLFSSGISAFGKDVQVGAEARIGRNVCVGGSYEVGEREHIDDGATLEGDLPEHLRAWKPPRVTAAL